MINAGDLRGGGTRRPCRLTGPIGTAWRKVPGGDEPGELELDAFAQSVNAGRVVGTNGPFVSVELAGAGDETVGLGETMAVDPGGQRTLRVRVQTTEWVRVSELQVFVNATERIPEEVRDAATFTGLFFDHDGDADLDLYLSNDFGPFIMPNQLLINEGGAFRQMLDSDPDYCWCLPTMQGMGAQIGDVDDDGDFDLHLTNIGQTYLYLALGDGTYADGAVVAGLEPTTRVSKTSWGAKFLDADLDGDEDLLVVMGSHDPANPNIAPAQPDVYFANTGAGKFVDHSLGSGFDDDGIGRGLATGDLDRDGLPDVVVATQLGVIVLRSEGGCTPGVTLTIDAGPGNRQGYQALVRFTMPDGSERLRMMSPATTFGASAAELYLPAPYASTVPRIEVEVPGRAPVVYEHVPIGTRLHVTL